MKKVIKEANVYDVGCLAVILLGLVDSFWLSYRSPLWWQPWIASWVLYFFFDFMARRLRKKQRRTETHDRNDIFKY